MESTIAPPAARDGQDARAAAFREKLAGLRRALVTHSIDAYLVPMNDAHSSEYVGAADKRIEWLTGFSGSAATVVVTAEVALLWTDARYFLQAAEELEGTGFTLMKQDEPGVPGVQAWIAERRRAEPFAVGVDPRLFTLAAAEEWALAGCSPSLIDHNLVDFVWGSSKPAVAAQPLILHGAPAFSILSPSLRRADKHE